MTTTQTRRAGRRQALSLLGAGLALLSLAGIVSCGTSESGPAGAAQPASPAATAQAPGAIEGVRLYDNLSSEHVTTPVTYSQSPAVGGDHSPRWTNCGIYTSPVEQTRAVHSMEHGAVWLTYQPSLPAAQIQQLTDLVGSRGFVVLSPHPDQASAVTATAWGVQLAVDTASDPRLGEFLTTYIQGGQTPEPGAPCTGGVDG